MKTPKYTTLTELSAAFKSGELDDTYSIQIDKGGSCLSLGQVVPEDETDDEIDERYERCCRLFSRAYGDPTEELLALAGIPSNHA